MIGLILFILTNNEREENYPKCIQQNILYLNGCLYSFKSIVRCSGEFLKILGHSRVSRVFFENFTSCHELE